LKKQEDIYGRKGRNEIITPKDPVIYGVAGWKLKV
jgi:hypothetical protein